MSEPTKMITLSIEDKINNNIQFDYIYDIDTNQNIIKRFNAFINQYYKDVDDDFKKYVENPENIGLIKIIKNKYPHLSRAPRITKRTKKLDVKAYVFEMLESHLYKDSVQYKFTRE